MVLVVDPFWIRFGAYDENASANSGLASENRFLSRFYLSFPAFTPLSQTQGMAIVDVR